MASVVVMLVTRNLELAAKPIGILFLCGSVLVAVGYSVALIKLTKLYKPLTITWVQNIVGMIYFIPIVLIMERFQPSNFANVNSYIVPLVCLGVCCSAIAYALWAFCFSKLGASKANVYSNLIPVFTAVFSFFIIHESLTPNKIIGIVLVVVGLILSQQKRKTTDSTNTPL